MAITGGGLAPHFIDKNGLSNPLSLFYNLRGSEENTFCMKRGGNVRYMSSCPWNLLWNEEGYTYSTIVGNGMEELKCRAWIDGWLRKGFIAQFRRYHRRDSTIQRDQTFLSGAQRVAKKDMIWNLYKMRAANPPWNVHKTFYRGGWPPPFHRANCYVYHINITSKYSANFLLTCYHL